MYICCLVTMCPAGTGMFRGVSASQDIKAGPGSCKSYCQMTHQLLSCTTTSHLISSLHLVETAAIDDEISTLGKDQHAKVTVLLATFSVVTAQIMVRVFSIIYPALPAQATSLPPPRFFSSLFLLNESLLLSQSWPPPHPQLQPH